MTDDYYSILGVSKNANDVDIKKAYRKLAIKHHPDKNKDDKASEETFKKLGEAYSVLSDSEKRNQYDQVGHHNFVNSASSGGFNRSSDPFEAFNSFFQGGFHKTEPFNKTNSPRVGSNLKIEIEVSLQDIIYDTTKVTKYKRHGKCTTCNGKGVTDESKIQNCATCGGNGVVYRRMGPMQVQQVCPSCGGEGTYIVNPCGRCSGQGIMEESLNINIKIPKGVHTGSRLRISDHGNFAKGGTFGNIEQGPSERDKEDRKQYDLVSNINVGQLFPKKWGLNIPFNFGQGEEYITPEYDQQYRDITLSSRIDQAESQEDKDAILKQSEDYTKRKSINLIGVNKQRTNDDKTPRFYDMENLTFNYSYILII